MSPTAPKRINYIDGFRGVAITLVVLYHAYSRWSNLILFTKSSHNIIVFKYGWLGVQLFFLISGYVILMSLEKSTSLINFIKKRLLRIYPALIAASILIFISAPLFENRPLGQPKLTDFIPSIFFVEPIWFAKIFHIKLGMIETSFWSLLVEIRFYFIFSFIYFYINKSNATWYIFLLFIVSAILTFISNTSNNIPIRNLHLAIDIIGLQHYGWFASGGFLYQYLKDKNIDALLSSIFIGLVSVLYMSFVQFHSMDIFIMMTTIFVLFILSSFIGKLQTLLANKMFLFIGMISYPLYLIHENIMVSLILKFENYFPKNYILILPLTVFGFVIILAYLFTFYIEPLMSKIISPIFGLKTTQHSPKVLDNVEITEDVSN